MSAPSPNFSAERILEALAQVPAHVAVLLGPDHRYAFVNDALRTVLGIEDPIGKPFGASHHSTTEALRKILDRVHATGKAWVGNEVLIAGLGAEHSDRYFNLNFLPLLGKGSAVEGVIIHSFDVTELVRARKAIAEKGNLLRRLVDGNIVGIGFWREGGAFLEANDELLRLVGFSREDVAGGAMRWASLMADETAAKRALAELATHGSLAPFETELVRKDGVRVPVLFGGAALGANEKGKDGVGFVLDLTERRRADKERAALQAQLLHVQKLESLGVLAGGIAHDFNNMLAAVQGSVSAAALMLMAENPAQRVLLDALDAVRRAADLTRQLLAYSGKGQFQIQRLDLSTQVAELAHLLETTLPKKVHLRLDLPRDLPPIEADPAQIQQVIMNLVLNGAEAIGEARGTVLVTSGVQEIDALYAASLLTPTEVTPGKYVFIEVHDDGAGMDAATLEKIFDPFFTTKFTGRGLGLAAVLGIVRAHRGAIKVYSSPGKGTTFRVFFPATSGVAAAPVRAAPSSFRGEGLVLVIDDDRGVRLALRHLLRELGFDVIEAEDGRRGAETFAAHAPDVRLVVLDMTMPELNGEETFRELRRVRADIPVILSSGYNELEATRRFSAKGLAAFLPKPFTPEDLVRCIRAALNRSP